jgi:phosphate transport system substrate-binding protein
MKKALTILLALTFATGVFAQAKVDPAIKNYKKQKKVKGNLSAVGSDTLLNLMTYWAEDFSKVYPGVKTQIEGKGSSTAPPALIEGASQLGPMSRKMKEKEEDAFVEKFGYKPTYFAVAIDSLAVYVNKDNPLTGLTLEQVDAIFSKTRNFGAPSDITTWDQVGLTGSWAGRPISLYGRNSASGTYGYFKKKAMKKGDYKDTVKEQPGSASVVQGIETDLYGIGYSGIGYITSGVKAIALGKDAGTLYEPSVENALNKKYPLARQLYMYVNKEPKKKLPKVVSEFMLYIFSQEGQQIVVKDGYIPLPADLIEDQIKAVKSR